MAERTWEELSPEEQNAAVAAQSSTARMDTARAEQRHLAENPVQGPEALIVPSAETYAPDFTVSGQTFNTDYYQQVEDDYVRANEQLGDGIVGSILNPIANPIANIGRQIMYGGNIAVNVGREIYRKATNGPADPAWTPEAITKWMDTNKESIPQDQRWRYYGTINPSEAAAMQADADAYTAAMRVNAMRGGFENFTAGALAGLIDIDTPLIIMSGGLSASAKLGINASRAGRLLSGTAAGAAVGLSVGAVNYAVSPTSDAESVLLIGVMGAGFGMVSGSLARHVDAAADMRMRTADELGEQMHYGPRPERGVPEREMRTEPDLEVPAEKPAKTGAESAEPEKVAPAPNAFDPEQVEMAPDVYDPLTHSGASSVGARQTGKRLYEDPGNLVNKAMDPLVNKAMDPLVNKAMDPVVNKAIRFQQTANAIGAGTDFDTFMRSGASSVGARQTGKRLYDGPGRAGITNKESLDVYDKAANWKRSSQAVRDYEDPGNLGNPSMDPLVNKAIRFQQTANAIGAGTDFDTFMRSGLATAQWFASNILESASGIARSKTNAAVIKEAYHKELVQAIRPIQAAFKEWHFQEQGHKWYDWLRTPQGQGAWKSKEDFHWEIIQEQMARRHGGQGTTSPAAKKAADALEAFYKKDYEIGLGNKGQQPVSGYDKFTREPGYVSQHWSGRKMSQMVEDAARKGGANGAKQQRKAFVDAIDEEYARLHASIPAPVRRKMAAAVVDRALASRRGFQHDLIGLLRGDEGEFIRAALKRNNVSDKEIDKVMDSIIGSRQQKTQAGHTQMRTDVDFRSVATNGVRMRDMLETDIDLMTARRANTTSGTAAMARMGIPDKVAFERIKKAILDEQQARGKKLDRPNRTLGDKVDDFIDREPEITEELLDAVYGYFSGNRPGAGQNFDPTIQRIKKLTRLSLMNQLGLTSMAEHGAIAGAVGWRRWAEHMSQDLKEAMGKPQSPLNQELRHFAFFESEESLFNGRLLYEMDKAQSGELMSKLDSVLNKGLELQGYLSGYHQVVGMQQRIAISSLTARIFEGFKTGKGGLNAQRMQDLGLDDAFMARVSKHAQFEGDNLKRLNMDQWDWEDVQLYQQVMARGANQLVQKAMAGESNWAFQSTGLAQLFMQFKSFPLLAVHKQFTRNMRMADLGTVNTFFFGLITAGAAYSARQVINGNTDNLTAEKIAKGALNYSNMTGWIPMFVDPVLNAAGADFDTSGYSSHGVGSVISLPASFGTMEKLVQLPFMPAKLGLAAAGQYDVKNSDIRVIQAMPIFGNAFGINGLLNMAKEAPTRGPRAKTVEEPAPSEEQEFDPVAAALAVIQPPQ